MRTWIKTGVSALALSSLACTGLTMRGADSVKPGREPPSERLAAFQTTGCVGSSGGGMLRNTTVEVVQLASGNRVLIEKTPGYDTLIVKNAFADRGEIAFQAVLKAKNGRMMLHEFRVPNDLNAPGRLSVVQSWRETSLQGGGFRGDFSAPIMTCTLALAGPADAPSSLDPEPEEEAPKTDAQPADTLGTAEPRDSYAVGEFVAVDVQGKRVRAKVVQALESGRYYVEYQTTPASSEWVEKSRILGKLAAP